MTTPGTPKKQNTILIKKRISLNVHVVVYMYPTKAIIAKKKLATYDDNDIDIVRVRNCDQLVAKATENLALATRISRPVASRRLTFSIVSLF